MIGERVRRFAIAALLTLVYAAPAPGQTLPRAARSVSLAGPRVGVMLLDTGVADALQQRNINIRRDDSLPPVISQLGWQFEKQFFTTDGGLTAVTEWVGLVGGLDQSLVIPSLSWMVGLRTPKGAELVVGPNITPAGAALAMALSVTLRAGGVNIPVNATIVPSSAGMTMSWLIGFNLRGRR